MENKRSEGWAMKKSYVLMMAMVVVTLWAAAAQANLLVNGSFETGPSIGSFQQLNAGDLSLIHI